MAAVVVAVVALLFLSISSTINAQVFDVTKYGAIGDGKTMINQALLWAWQQACESTRPSTVLIPRGHFALGEVTIQGPCKAPIEVQLQGTLIAPAHPSQFKGNGWVTFERIDRFTLSGSGTFNGQGQVAWSRSECRDYCILAPNLRFNFITNGLLRDIASLDSKFFHVVVFGCTNFNFHHFTATAPNDSPNTDGIHIGRSSGVNITDSNIGTGDDCISLGDGSRDIFITRVNCGPGHGISIGSLGKYQGEEPVVGVTIKNCTLTGTQNGVRIKTWPALFPGAASWIRFEDVQMINVSNPILIDQMYCPSDQCNGSSPSLVKLSHVWFKNIWGTSSTQEAVKLVCSGKLPCEDVRVHDIYLSYNGGEGRATSVCSNVKPIVSGTLKPAPCA